MPIHVIRHFRFCMDNPTPLSIYSSALPSPPFYKVPLQTFHHIGFFHTAKNYIILVYILSIPTLLITWPFRYFPLLHCLPQQQQKPVPPSSSLPIRQFTSVQMCKFRHLVLLHSFPQQGQSCLYLYWYALFSLSLFILCSKCSQCNLMFKHIIYYIFKCHFM